ncbi:MAG TPA: urease accessory protein UreE [Candidatus Methylomirabilis sp.]|nr:urease accessory protein UreE [Candidatus Methylomirabilis sp.]
MLVITGILHVQPAALRDKERDVLRLAWDERRWTRKRVVTASGREVALALPTGSLLKPGDVLAVEETWCLVVEARAEPVLAVFPRSRDEAVRIAFDVGNRHFPLAVEGDLLLVPDDTAMAQLLSRLGAVWERRQSVFDPIGAGHRHEAGASPVDGHRHGADD